MFKRFKFFSLQVCHLGLGSKMRCANNNDNSGISLKVCQEACRMHDHRSLPEDVVKCPHHANQIPEES